MAGVGAGIGNRVIGDRECPHRSSNVGETCAAGHDERGAAAAPEGEPGSKTAGATRPPPEALSSFARERHASALGSVCPEAAAPGASARPG
jgi:hypothetical protein